MGLLKKSFWIFLTLVAALAMGVIATRRGEPINAVWLVAAASCVFVLGYRYYSRFIALRGQIIC